MRYKRILGWKRLGMLLLLILLVLSLCQGMFLLGLNRAARPILDSYESLSTSEKEISTQNIQILTVLFNPNPASSKSSLTCLLLNIWLVSSRDFELSSSCTAYPVMAGRIVNNYQERNGIAYSIFFTEFRIDGLERYSSDRQKAVLFAHFFSPSISLEQASQEMMGRPLKELEPRELIQMIAHLEERLPSREEDQTDEVFPVDWDAVEAERVERRFLALESKLEDAGLLVKQE